MIKPIRSLLLMFLAFPVMAQTPLEDYSAPIKTVTVSSEAHPVYFTARNATDWNWISRWQSNGEREGAWIEYTFPRPVRVGVILLVDQANSKGAVEEVRFDFSDGDPVPYALPTSPAYIPEQNAILHTPIDMNLNLKTDMGAHYIRLEEPRVTTKVRITITRMAEGATPAGLAEFRVVEVPADPVQPVASPERIEAAALVGYGLTPHTPDGPFEFKTSTYAFTVSEKTGLPILMTDLLPTPVDFIGGNSEASPFVLYLDNIDRGWSDRFNQLRSWHRQSGIEGGEAFEELTCVIAPEKHPVALAHMRYRIFDDRIETRVRFEYLVNDWSRYRMGLYNLLNPEEWPSHRAVAGALSTRLSPPHAPAYQVSFTHAYDIMWEEGGWYNLVFPMGFFERDDRYLSYGSFDLGKHLVFGPHTPVENSFPSVFVMPLGLREGDGYEIELFFKTFSKADSGYMEMYRWYGERTHLRDPDFKGVPVRITDPIPRTLPYGVMTAGLEDDPTNNEATYEAILREAERSELFNVLYGGWDIWVHSPEVFEGASWGGYLGPLSTEAFRDNIAMLKSRGFHPYLYINNFVAPPWLEAKKQLISPDDDKERDWYLARAKSMVNILQPGGLFWDCGWWPLHYASPNNQFVSDPRSDMGRGWLKVQAELFVWMRETYPEMHVVGNNMAGGTPSQYFKHATTIESGLGRNTIEESVAFGTAVINLHTPIIWNDTFESRGVSVEEAIEKGISTEVATSIWNAFVKGNRHSLAYGVTQVGLSGHKVKVSPERRRAFPYGERTQLIPESLRIRELERFNALANAIPILPETHVLKTGNPAVIGSVWAGEGRILAAMYNNSDESVTIDAVIDRAILAKYNVTKIPRLRLIRLGPDWIATGRPDVTGRVSDEFIHLSGTIGPYETILMQ